MSAPTRRSRRRAPLLAGAAIAAVAATLVTAPQAQAVLAGVSAGVDPDTRFPSWYSDSTGTKLKLCVDSRYCLGGNSLPITTAKPSVFTGNLPDEAFYAVARAETELKGGGRIRWRAVLEGAFANDAVVNGDQITFARVQVTGSKINTSVYPVGTVLTFETPYGNLSAPVLAKGKLSRERIESNPGDPVGGWGAPVVETATGFGCTAIKCIATTPSRFLRWDGVDAPPGFLGDPATPHTITGGVRDTFTVKRGTAVESPVEDEFEIAGQKVLP
jgi:hypothetical protein